MSKFECTFCTSSCSSSASIKRIIVLAAAPSNFDVVLRNHGNAGGDGLNAGFLHGLQDGFISGSLSQDLPVVAIVVQIFPTGFEHDVHQVVLFRRRLGDEDVAFLVEHPRDGSGFGHVAAVLAKDVTDLADGAVTIVGIDVEQYGDATGP